MKLSRHMSLGLGLLLVGAGLASFFLFPERIIAGFIAAGIGLFLLYKTK